ncbi:uncharacterized protein L201_001984 [Kwoniella dendrophila CBS 6074]|uniref:RNA polymerase II elongation factor ELL N-terminal domain-containing protein n=1 Tax=Kwoniella dendrophila CBS 6074 TaxID=1295534 RepID=A0AAX4JQF0_9TREE
MPLPSSGSIPLVSPNAEQPSSAYLIKFPEEVWSSLQEAKSGGLDVTISVDGRMSLNIPNLPPITLDPRSTGIPSELHSYNPNSNTLSLSAIATTRLNVPLTSASTARAADKLKAQNEAIERERKERSIRVEGSAPPSKKRAVERLAPGIGSSGMGRTNSSPQITSSSSANANAAASSGGAGSSSTTTTGQMIPLKTRVMQLLALGPTTVLDIIRRVGGDEQNVMRVVNVVGRASSTNPPRYTLLPNQYSKIKLGPGQWKYTYAEQQQVIRLAREAFDELELPFDAEEREDLDRKEAELEGGYHSAESSNNGNASQEQSLFTLQTVPQNGLSTAPPSQQQPSTSSSSSSSTNSNSQKRNISPNPPPSSIAPTKTKTSNGTNSSTAGVAKKTGPQSKIARERAKFMAEKQRSTSLPNTKAVEGTASPRSVTTELKPPAKDNEKEKDKSKDRRKEDKPNGKIIRDKGKAREVDYSSSDDDEESGSSSRSRRLNQSNGKDKKDEKLLNANSNGNKSKDGKPSLADKVRERDKAKEREKALGLDLRSSAKKRSYSSSDNSDADAAGEIEDIAEEGEIRGRPISKIGRDGTSITSKKDNNNNVIIQKRKPPPPELKLDESNLDENIKSRDGNSNRTNKSTNNQSNSAPLPKIKQSSLNSNSNESIRSTGNQDQESLRDRYEELYPAYQQLTKKLTKIHQSAEHFTVGDNFIDQSELSKLVKKWEKWHKELENIRRWFTQ